MKRWEKAIDHKWRSKSAHAFLLYLNVADDFLNNKGEFEKLPDYLISSTAVGKAHFVATFNRGTGIRFTNGQEENFIKFLTILKPAKDASGTNTAEREFRNNRNKLDYALTLFAEMLEVSWQDKRKNVAEALKEYSDKMELDREKQTGPFFSVIFEYAETLAPPDSATASCEPDRKAIVSFLVLARSRVIRDANNLFVMLTDSLQLVAPALKSETNGVVPLKIEFPDQGDRETAIIELRKQYNALPGDIDVKTLSHVTAGMSRNVIGNLIKESAEKKRPIDYETVFKKKRKFIEEQSGGLLQIMQPLWGIEAIGGLVEHKRYIKEVVASMQKNNFLAVPMGAMLLGAPGTGKTVFAQAVAHEAEIPFVTLKNIREMWVGQSERNLDFALELIRAQAPVVVFVDEIDQQFQMRGGPVTDGGVDNRMQGRLFEFMSDTDLRGKTLWIAASNRPDLIDPAMLREGRFDEKIPFFLPNAKERGEILEAILQKMKAQTAAHKQELSWNIPPEYFEEFGWHSHRHMKRGEGIVPCDPDTHSRNREDDTELPFTGAQIEVIVQKAYTLASANDEVLGKDHLEKTLNDYIPGHDIGQYTHMTEMAIQQCNSDRFIPEGYWRKRARQLRGQRNEGGMTTIKV
jgi:SpoVK/Ycf46/Vps4 family AAA+-type ATPase